MTEKLVPTLRTHMTAADVYAALLAAWSESIATVPSRASLLTLLAQWSLETGGGGSCNNNNLGGIKHVAGDGHDYAMYLTREVINGKSVLIDQNFRAYRSIEEGAADYIHILRNTFGFAWPAVEAGDVADFAHRLKQRGYYTADEHEYAAGLRARYMSLDHLIPSDSSVADINPLFVVPGSEPDKEPPGVA